MKINRTVVVWDELDANVQFFVLVGDYTHLNHQYINSTETTDEQVDEINDIVYSAEGAYKVTMLSEFPLAEVKDGAAVIVMGFLP